MKSHRLYLMLGILISTKGFADELQDSYRITSGRVGAVLTRYVQPFMGTCFKIQILKPREWTVTTYREFCGIDGKKFNTDYANVEFGLVEFKSAAILIDINIITKDLNNARLTCSISIEDKNIEDLICKNIGVQPILYTAIPESELPLSRTIDAVGLINLERHEDTLIRYIKWQHSQCFTIQVLSSDTPWGVLSSKDICELEGKSFYTDVAASSFDDISLTAKGLEVTLDIFPLLPTGEELRSCVIPIDGTVIGPLTCGEPRPAVYPGDK